MWSKQTLADNIRSVVLQLPRKGCAKPARPAAVQQVLKQQCLHVDAISLQIYLIEPHIVLQMTKGQLLIKRVIMLVVLLDQTAMLADLPSQAPLLFGVSGSIKSSAEVGPVGGAADCCKALLLITTQSLLCADGRCSLAEASARRTRCRPSSVKIWLHIVVSAGPI